MRSENILKECNGNIASENQKFELGKFAPVGQNFKRNNFGKL